MQCALSHYSRYWMIIEYTLCVLLPLISRDFQFVCCRICILSVALQCGTSMIHSSSEATLR